MLPFATPSEPAHVNGPSVTWDRRSLFYLALLALPFAACLTYLLLSGRTFPVFWGTDEEEYWMLMQWFAKRLPGFEPVYPHSATAPLFQWAGAWVIALVGPNIQCVRALNALASFGGVAALFTMLRRPFRFAPATAALLTATVAFSAYFFGYSFRLLTDNLALTFCLLTLRELFLSVAPDEASSRRHFLAGCGWFMATILTRQSFLFLGLPFVAALAISARPIREKMVDLLVLGMATVPLILLMLAWKGLVPPDFRSHHTTSVFHLYALSLPLMLLGLYAPAFFAVPAWRGFRAGEWPASRLLLPGLVALLALAVVARYPLLPTMGAEGPAYFSADFRASPPTYSGGWIYTIGQKVPRLLANSLWYWLLLPLGAASAVWFGTEFLRRGEPLCRVAMFFLLGVLISCTANGALAQKYYDALILLFLAWTTHGNPAGDFWRRLPLLGLLGVFALYYVTFPLLTKPKAAPPSLALAAYR